MGTATLEHEERPAEGTARSAVVLLHSRAGDEREVRPVLGKLDPERRHLGLMPLGPLQLGDEGRNWYSIEREAAPDPASFLTTLDVLSRWLDDTLVAHGLDLGRTAIAGFSQGAVMAYSLAFARGRPDPAAVLAFSGYFPRVEGFDLDVASRKGVPVSISHGSLDRSISIRFAREARALLEQAGAAVSYLEEPVGHKLTPAALAQGRSILAAALH